VSARVCSSCGRVNPADGEICANCGASLTAVAPAPAAPGAPIPPAPGLGVPAPPGAVPPTPTKRRRTWIIAGVIGLVAVIVIATIAAVAASGDGNELPDQVAGFDRLHTAQVQTLEDQMEQVKFGDLQIEMAAYGTGDDVELMLARYSNFPVPPAISALLRGAGGGIVGTGGTVDFDAETVETRDGVEYHCIPFVGRLFPDDPTDTQGQACVWAEGADYALLMDARTVEAEAAIDDASAAHDALG
jgi:hypothetical protein